VDCASLMARCRQVAPRTRILLTWGQLPDGSLDNANELLLAPYNRE
jgi:hypothetical protein